MRARSVFLSVQHLITQDQRFTFTILSYITILLIFINMWLINSAAIGIVASAIYLLINAIYLGHSLFKGENAFFEFMLGLLLLIVILGMIAWAVLILYNLNNTGSVIALSITSSFASFLNRKVKSRNAI